MKTTTHVQRMLQVSADVTARARRGSEDGAAIDVSSLRHVLAVDVAARTCVAEPLVTFRELVTATRRHGLAPRAIPWLDSITLGEAVAGCADGGFHESCIEYEVVTKTGDVVRCSRRHDRKLFEMMHGSRGTPGIVTQLTVELVEASALGRHSGRTAPPPGTTDFMVLDARIAKLAKGQSAKEAALAFARSQNEKLAGDDRARAEEFEAILEAMFLMAAVDGEVAKDEIGLLAASVQGILDSSGGRARVDLGKALDDLGARLERDGWKVRLDSLAPRLPTHESRAFALRLAAGVAFVDDNVVHAEAAAIDALCAALGIPSDESQVILGEVHEELFGG